MAEATFHQQSSECFLAGLVRSREFDIPEIGTRFENVDGIKEAFWFAINFSDDAGTSGSDAVAIEQALERDFLAGENLFCDSQNAAVAADEQGYGGNAAHHSGGVHPRGFERDAKGDAVALAKDFCAHGGHEKGKSTA